MPVIINDFEIVDEPPAQARGTGTAAPVSPSAPPALRPEDIERIVRHFIERRARIAAD